MINLIPAKIKIGELFKKYIDTENVDILEEYKDFDIKMEKSKNAYVIKFFIHYNENENFKTYSCSYPNNKKTFNMELLECHLQELED